jgi:hypothetical protein
VENSSFEERLIEAFRAIRIIERKGSQGRDKDALLQSAKWWFALVVTARGSSTGVEQTLHKEILDGVFKCLQDHAQVQTSSPGRTGGGYGGGGYGRGSRRY